MNILYSTGCPKCTVLKMKLDQNGIEYAICEDREKMEKMEIDAVPMLYADGMLMNFKQANEWINQKGIANAYRD